MFDVSRLSRGPKYPLHELTIEFGQLMHTVLVSPRGYYPTCMPGMFYQDIALRGRVPTCMWCFNPPPGRIR